MTLEPMDSAPVTNASVHYQHCVHCGLCLPHCPTYLELADENDSPRGRIYLMQAVDQNRVAESPSIERHLDLCLNCRACETACPSGVPYGRLIEDHRLGRADGDRSPQPTMRRLIRHVLLLVFPWRRRTRWLVSLTRAANAMGFFEFIDRCQPGGRYAAALRFPDLLDHLPSPSPPLPRHSRPARSPRAQVGLFLGCVSEAIHGHTNRAMHRVLLHNHCAVTCPPHQGCCGALHYHFGDREAARELARRNIRAFEEPGTPLNAVVVAAAGCGLMLKDYPVLLADDPDYAARAREFAHRVRDIHEFLYALPCRRPPHPVPARVTYHDACHLRHGQNVHHQPRALLNMIDGLKVRELRESALCCGAAGSYSLTQPDMAARLARRKLQHIEETDCQFVAAANIGCILHLQQHAALNGRPWRIVHPLDLLDAAYGHPPTIRWLAIPGPEA